MTGNKIIRKMNVRQGSVRKMSCQVDVMSGKCVQEFEPEPPHYVKFVIILSCVCTNSVVSLC